MGGKNGKHVMLEDGRHEWVEAGTNGGKIGMK